MRDKLLFVAQRDWKLYLTPEECRKESAPLEDPLPAKKEEYLDWFVNNREYHSWPELYYVLEGSEFFGWKEGIIRIKSPSVLLIPPYQSHAYLYPPGPRESENIWISLGESNVAIMYYPKGKEGTSLPVIGHCGVLEGAIPLLLDSWNGLRNSDPHGPAYPLMREKLRLQVCAVLLESVELLLRQESRNQPAGGVEKIKSLIDAHPGISYSLDELSDLAGYSKYHFHRLFTRLTGNTPKEYITQRRIIWAYELLRRGSSCKAAAAELGFSDPAAFSRWFKAGRGVSPGEILPLGDLSEF